MDRQKLEQYLIESMPEDESSELHRYLQDLLIKIEFGHFEPDDGVDE